MLRIHIDNATNPQLDYAMAVAQNFDIKINRNDIYIPVSIPGTSEKFAKYSPTTNLSLCMELIINSKISCKYIDKPGFAHHEFYYCRANKHECGNPGVDKNLLIAVVKAFLWSKYPDGYLPVSGDNHVNKYYSNHDSLDEITELTNQLKEGVIYHQKRWSGDTHDDLGGSINEQATDSLMLKAAELIETFIKKAA